jgi:Zn-finger nucleic acid-binding protein
MQAAPETALICPGCKARKDHATSPVPHMHAQVLTNGLACQRCEQCHGMVLNIGTYSDWSARQRETASQAVAGAAIDPAITQPNWQAAVAEPLQDWLKPNFTPGPAPPEPVNDSPHALVCPCCTRLMLRYRVAELGIGLDFCFACTLVWLDRGEWELLAQHGLHLKITQISTAYWQRSQQKHRLQAQREADLREVLGEHDFEQAMRVHQWLLNHPQRELILRFVRSDPPEA